MYHARTKHKDVGFYKINELVSYGELLFEKGHISENTIDMLITQNIIVTIYRFKYYLNLINVFNC